MRLSNAIYQEADLDQDTSQSQEINGSLRQTQESRLRTTNINEEDKTISFVDEHLAHIPPGLVGAAADATDHYQRFAPGRVSALRLRLRRFITRQRNSKTPTLLRQIWHSDWTIAAFIPMIGCYYAMKYTGIPIFGVLFFSLGVATIDAILTIFVTRLSFHTNKSRFYQTEDYERDWLRYRVLMTLTKGVLFFIIGMKCGWTALIGAQIVWFFGTTERIRHFILRWSMEDSYPELEKWSIFMFLKQFGIKAGLREFNIVAIIGLVLGIGVTLIF